MKKITALIFTFVISVPVLAFGQSMQLPDYTKWEEISTMKLSVVLNGKDVGLGLESYRTTDNIALRHQSVYIIYDEQDLPWLAQYQEDIGEKQQDETENLKESRVYWFENRNGKWVEVWRSIVGFLRQNYKLEIK